MAADSVRNPVFEPENRDSAGDMQHNATFCDLPSPLALDEAQMRAIELILQGLGDIEIAKILEIHRSTLWRWKTQNQDFQDYLQAARDQLHLAAMDAYQNNLRRATNVLGEFMDDKVKRTRLRAAQIVLNMAGTFRPSNIGPSRAFMPR